MTLNLPDVSAATRMSEAELKLELACALYAQGKVSAVGGSQLAGVDLLNFQGALVQRGIPRNYSVRDLRDDVAALHALFPG